MTANQNPNKDQHQHDKNKELVADQKMHETTSFHFIQGHIPLLVSMPHVGTIIPDAIGQKMTLIAQQKVDTDWHLPHLYNMLEELGASCIQAHYSRYVIDLNRPKNDLNLYPGQDTTGLCPIDTFKKEALYLEGNLPNAEEVQRRVMHYWQPYHQQLETELHRLRAQHGIAILWDAHSIASHVPRFFEGKLPDLNFGTVDQTSCDIRLQNKLQDKLRTLLLNEKNARPLSHIFNGRFKGGYITRHYGQPHENIHAIQLEMSQSVYMDEHAPFTYREELARQVQPLLRQLLQATLDWAGTYKVRINA